MPIALIAALFFTVAMLVTTAYFILGSVPLLVLKHDTPLDSRFVRAFFNLYYKTAMFVGVAAALSFMLAGKPGFGVGAASLAVLAFVLRGKIIARMDAVGAEIESSGTVAIERFRRTHVIAIMLNIAQLALIVWSLIAFSLR